MTAVSFVLGNFNLFETLNSYQTSSRYMVNILIFDGLKSLTGVK